MPSKTSTLHSQVCLTIRNKLNMLAFSVIQFWLWSSKLCLLESAWTSEDHIHGYILWPWGATPSRQITMVTHGQKKYIINSKPIRKGKGKKKTTIIGITLFFLMMAMVFELVLFSWPIQFFILYSFLFHCEWNLLAADEIAALYQRLGTVNLWIIVDSHLIKLINNCVYFL